MLLNDEYSIDDLKVGSAVSITTDNYTFYPMEVRIGFIESETKDSWFVTIKGEVVEFDKNSLYSI